MPPHRPVSRLAALWIAACYLLAGGWAAAPIIEYSAAGQACCAMAAGKSCCCCKTAGTPLSDAPCLLNAPCGAGAPGTEIHAGAYAKHLAADGPNAGAGSGMANYPRTSPAPTIPPQFHPIEKIPIELPVAPVPFHSAYL